MRRLEAEAFSGAMIESMHGKCNLLRRDGIETHLLRKELSDQAVHVLVGSAFPGSIGMGKEEVGIKDAGDMFMPGKFLAIVRRQRVNTGCKRRQQGNHGRRYDIGRFGRHMRHQGIPRFPLVDRHQGLLMAGTDDQVSLPITKARTPVNDGWTLLDRHLIRDGSSPIATTIALPAGFLAAQGTVQATAQTSVGIDMLVDRFVADAGLAVGPQVTGDLLGAPQFAELGFCEGPGVGRNAAAILSGPHAGQRELMCLFRPITTLTTVAVKLTADRCRMSVHEAGNGALVMSGFEKDRNLVSFVSGEMCVVHSRQL